MTVRSAGKLPLSSQPSSAPSSERSPLTSDKLKISRNKDGLRNYFSLIEGDLDARQRWANKLSGFYTLRRTGHRRTQKPWPLAADLHSPIIDTDIDKMKPFYINQFFQVDRMVDMVGKDPQNSEVLHQLRFLVRLQNKAAVQLRGRAPYPYRPHAPLCSRDLPDHMGHQA